jgi:hypothetical protein
MITLHHRLHDVHSSAEDISQQLSSVVNNKRELLAVSCYRWVTLYTLINTNTSSAFVTLCWLVCEHTFACWNDASCWCEHGLLALHLTHRVVLRVRLRSRLPGTVEVFVWEFLPLRVVGNTGHNSCSVAAIANLYESRAEHMCHA